MLPGVNGGGGGGGRGPRNTGTLPKSNRRSDRNRERSAANQQNRSHHGHPQHFNNLFQLDWQVASECDRESRASKEAKKSNTRLASSQLPSSYFTTYQDLSDFASHNSTRQYNYSIEDCTPWIKMIPFIDPRTHSPSQLQGTKPSNVNKMPERSQVESRLNQIRDYIRVTATMIESLDQSSDPRAQAQSEKLSRMVDDLHDSETKLSKLLEQYHNNGISDENGEREDIDECGDASREMQLRRNMEEYQNKLAQLQEQQASLADMQICVRDRLNKARQAQQVLWRQVTLNDSPNSTTLEDVRAPLPNPANVEQLKSETVALRGKLAQLLTKKKQMDHLVAELQAIETSDRGSCSSEGSRNTIKDKTAELEMMKAQLAHIKALMEENNGTKIRDSIDFSSEPEQDIDAHDESAMNEITEDVTNISFENRSNDVNTKVRSLESNISDIETLTSELKEQSTLLQSTRAKLQRLKQPSSVTAHLASSNCPFSRPPPALIPLSANEKKQSFNAEAQSKQAKRHQFEDLIRKEPTQPSNMNRDVQASDQNSQRSSGSQASHTSIPANIWPPSAAAGDSNEQSVDGVSTSENLLDIGLPAAIENGGVVGNLWTCPIPPSSINQGQTATIEYYRQLLLGSQAHQLQMMGTTMQQCCQLLWSQQRELQSMRAAIAELQLRSQNQAPQRINNAETQEEHSNLSRSVHNLGDTLDTTLPPSSSLPNLVSLPNSSAALSHTPVVSSNLQQQQQQQLNNQVPPGNRANNYWDNFRSYSRQNLLSGNVKTMTDSSMAVANSTCSANTTNTNGSSVNSSLIKERNREQGSDNLSLPLTGAETQYSLNLQLPSNLQQQDRENTAIRSNIITNEMSQQVDNLWEETHSSFRLPSATNDDNLFNNLSSELKEAISSLIAVNKKRPDYLIIILREIKAISEDHRLRSHLLRSLRALQDKQTLNNPLNEAPDLTPSESYQSSDEDSDADFALENASMIDHSAMLKMVVMSQISHVDTASSPVSSQISLIEHLEITGTSPVECASAVPSTSNTKPGYNEDLAEADQSRPESSGNQKLPINDIHNEEGQEEAASYPITAEAATPDFESLAAKTEDEREEDTIDNFFRLH
ncbi:Pericentriolar material 1 protein [Trachymyrmex septentrionalis]|uniref:Pericentriolar material 1 protein n=1 Tax=Trachymyrmex septentrionalis TaxID=34720 RepID=A0A195FC67_9HYME|nr:Pericentriolar material 1 protein [Trachymyrmex septentrionalis]